MPSENFKKLNKDIEKASKEKNESLRGVKIAAVISEALKEIGEHVVLVGGAAVAFYTNSRYTTKDIDMLAIGGKNLEKVMCELGFERLGKDYINEKLKIYVEFPGDALGYGEKSDKIIVDGKELEIISVEDLIVDRLCAFKFWKSEVDGLNALMLIELGKDDTARTEKRARDEDVLDALDHIRSVYQKVVREKLPPKEANELLTGFLRK